MWRQERYTAALPGMKHAADELAEVHVAFCHNLETNFIK